jgi:hypothetical protein
VLLFFFLLCAFMEGAAICLGATTNGTPAFLLAVAVMFTVLRIRRGLAAPVDKLVPLDAPPAEPVRKNSTGKMIAIGCGVLVAGGLVVLLLAMTLVFGWRTEVPTKGKTETSKVELARQQADESLAKVRAGNIAETAPTAQNLGFGPVIERVLELKYRGNDGSTDGLDLDTGRVIPRSVGGWILGPCVVANRDKSAGSVSVMALGGTCVLMPQHCFKGTVHGEVVSWKPRDWDTFTPEEIRAEIGNAKGDPNVRFCISDSAHTYFFKTVSNQIGILKTSSFTESENAIRFRYRMLLQPYPTQPSDEQIRHKMMGTWTCDSDPSHTFENKPDGSFVAREGTELIAEGMSQVKDGFIVVIITNASRPDIALGVQSNKIVSIDDHKMVGLSRQGGTIELMTAHKR